MIGKPIGVVGFCKLAERLGLARLPSDVTWLQMAAVGSLAGIGFTVSIFISSLAFDDPIHLMEAKTAVLAASLVAGLAGFFALRHEAKLEETAEADTATDRMWPMRTPLLICLDRCDYHGWREFLLSEWPDWLVVWGVRERTSRKR